MNFAGQTGLKGGSTQGGHLVTDDPRPAQRRHVPHAMVITIDDSIAGDEVVGRCIRVRDDLEGCTAERLVCDVAGVARPSTSTLDLIARLALTARRLGREMQLRDASAPLQDLLRFVGLADVAELRVEAERKAEEREEVLGVQEEGDAVDPVT